MSAPCPPIPADPALELLAALAPTPKPLAAMARDLGHVRQSDLKPLIKSLKAAGHQIRLGHSPRNGLTARVDRGSWERAQRAAAAYWSRRHRE